PRIPELQEQRPVRPRQVDPLVSEGVVGVADEEDGLGVQLVGEEELSEQLPGALVDRVQVEGWSAVDVGVLEDGAEEGADVELVDRGELREVRRVEVAAF